MPEPRDLRARVTVVEEGGLTAAAARLFLSQQQVSRAQNAVAPPEPSRAPTALAVFPHDNYIPLRHIANQSNRIVRWTEYDRGGHFAALEQPTLLVADIVRSSGCSAVCW